MRLLENQPENAAMLPSELLRGPAPIAFTCRGDVIERESGVSRSTAQRALAGLETAIVVPISL